MTLTEAQVEQWRKLMLIDYMADCCIADPVNREQINALCDLALAQIRGQEPVAWRYVVNGAHTLYSSIPVPDDAYDEGTLVPLFAAPQPAQGMVPVEPTQEYWDAVWERIKCDGHITGSASIMQIKRILDVCHAAMLAAAQKGEANCASATRPEVTRPETPAPAAPTTPDALANELVELINDKDEFGKRDPTVIPAELAERLVSALRQQSGAGSKDAERYQLLRAGINLPRYGHGIGNRLADAALDAELDKALKERTE